jgi:excisionase family DNA binding protein
MPTESTKRVTQGKIAFTIKEAAYATGLSRSLLYEVIGRGALHIRKCGARTVIQESDLRRFLRNLPCGPSSGGVRTRKRPARTAEAAA